MMKTDVIVPELSELRAMTDLELLAERTSYSMALLSIQAQLLEASADEGAGAEEWRRRAKAKCHRLEAGLSAVKNILQERRTGEREDAVLELIRSVQELIDDDTEVRWRRVELASQYFDEPANRRRAG